MESLIVLERTASIHWLDPYWLLQLLDRRHALSFCGLLKQRSMLSNECICYIYPLAGICCILPIVSKIVIRCLHARSITRGQSPSGMSCCVFGSRRRPPRLKFTTTWISSSNRKWADGGARHSRWKIRFQDCDEHIGHIDGKRIFRENKSTCRPIMFGSCDAMQGNYTVVSNMIIWYVQVDKRWVVWRG